MLQCLLPDTFRNSSILVLTNVPLYVAGPRRRKVLLLGHLWIFFLEFLLLAALFSRGALKLESGMFQILYLFCYLPHLLLLVFTIRPFWFRHLFVLGLQAIYMIFVHTLSLEAFK